ncbi:M1 family metallopeptidase [Leifsonia virtsii]|uniref:Aminopeptidase N n=1 Tax=Leifsonia virtsii TaxID=3035915 RepID=A0ABT8J4C4_9MICO|nr:M1 family metallopeptidase [Leifsonia virtsii]MDN4599114.1 M1 family metallopeptidase [Leifsonia virtsii]
MRSGRHHHPPIGRRLAAVAATAAIVAAIQLPIAAPAAAAPAPGAPTIGDTLFAGIGNGGYDVTHYDVAIAYNDDKTIDATTTISATATQELSSFSLDLEGLTVGAVQVNGVPAASFDRSSDPATSSYKLNIVPVSPVSGAFTVQVAYSGSPVTHVDPDGSSEGWVLTSDGFTALGQPVGTMTWLPSNNTPADKATYDISITAPNTVGGAPAAAVSNGQLVTATPVGDGSRTTWHWQQNKPMATELAMISYGKYLTYESDIALSSGRTIHEWTFVDPAVTTANQTTIQARRAALPEILNYLEAHYGPYPGDSTGFVVDITSLGYALETQDRPYFERSVSQSTFIHELAHQWFGDSVTPGDWNSIWLNEGPATFIPTQYAYDHGTSANSTATTYFNLWNSTAASNSRWTIPPAGMTDPADLFDWQVYSRGAMTLEALRQAITPAVFDDVMKTWTTRYAGQSRDTHDFIALAEELSGRDLTAFFQDWLFDADKPAWPATSTLTLASAPATGSVHPGDTVDYTLSLANTGQVPLTGGIVRVDAADLVDDADLATLPADLVASGSTLQWTVPDTALGDTATTTFSATVKAASSGGTLTATATGATLGITCATCTSTLTTPVVTGPAPITEADLTDATRNGVTASPDTIAPGAKVTVTLPTSAYDGQTVTALLFSSPRTLGTSTVTNRAITVTIPADAALGAHKLALADASGALIGWDDLSLAAAVAGTGSGSGTSDAASAGGTGDPLASTGSTIAGPAIAGGALALLIGVAAVTLAAVRRRRTTE